MSYAIFLENKKKKKKHEKLSAEIFTQHAKL